MPNQDLRIFDNLFKFGRGEIYYRQEHDDYHCTIDDLEIK